MKKHAVALAVCLVLLAVAPVTLARNASDSHSSDVAESHSKDSRGHGDSGIWWKWANFAILAGGLGYLIAKKAPAFFDSRTQAIQKGILEARTAREQAEARARQIQQRLDNLESEIEGLRRSAREELAAEEARLRAETEDSVHKIRVRAKQELAAAVKSATQDLKSHAAELAIELARQKVRERMTGPVNDSLVHSFVADLGRVAPGQSEPEVN